MANTTKREKTIKELFIGECWKYLHDNFHKFNETNKIKIALALATKDVPQQIDGMDMRQVVIMSEIKKESVPLRYNIGNPINAV